METFNKILLALATVLTFMHVDREYCFTISHKSDEKTLTMSYIFKPSEWVFLNETPNNEVIGGLLVKDKWGESNILFTLTEDDEPKWVRHDIETCDRVLMIIQTNKEEITVTVD